METKQQSTCYTSTLASFVGHLVASGKDDSWHVVSQMKKKRSWFLAIALPEDQLIIVRGWTDSVEILEDKWQWISFLYTCTHTSDVFIVERCSDILIEHHSTVHCTCTIYTLRVCTSVYTYMYNCVHLDVRFVFTVACHTYIELYKKLIDNHSIDKMCLFQWIERCIESTWVALLL